MSEKVFDRHLKRKVLVYVRQSSAHQLLHNEESRRLQYAMQERVRAMGWSDVDVVDDDLGRTASGTVERPGFQRMVAEVCLGQVGAVAARELSRFARNNREWQQLMEVCRLVDTLLIDHEAIYDTRSSNDRLLLGLKGSMNEYELDLLRLRSIEARYEKAARGEYLTKLPAGYVNADGRLEQDPDARTQQAIKLIFSKALELGSARQVFEWLLEQELTVPCSVRGGVIEWRQVTYGAVLRILKNPTYAGVYFYGRTGYSTRADATGLRRIRIKQPREMWRVWIQEHHAAYVSWQDFQRIQKMLSDNEMHWGGQSGVPREGNALMVGLLRCRKCGRKLSVTYRGPANNYSRYSCKNDGAEPGCFEFGGRSLDQTIAAQVLLVLRPAALQAAAQAVSDSDEQQDGLLTSLRLELEGARYAAERVRKQYDAVDPSNRLVADELERRWEGALQKVAISEERLERAQTTMRNPSPPSSAQLRELARDFESVWNASTTDITLKKRLMRALIEEVVVDVDKNESRIDLVIHWKGGVHSSASLNKFRSGQHATDIPIDIVEAIRVLARVSSDKTIAAYLTRNGIPPATGTRWTWKKVAAVRNHHSFPPASKQPKGKWLTMTAACDALGIDRNLLSDAVARQLVAVDHPLPTGPWVFSSEALAQVNVAELKRRLRKRAADDALENSGQLALAISTTSLKGAE